jgi:hypothetical protein
VALIDLGSLDALLLTGSTKVWVEVLIVSESLFFHRSIPGWFSTTATLSQIMSL